MTETEKAMIYRLFGAYEKYKGALATDDGTSAAAQSLSAAASTLARVQSDLDVEIVPRPVLQRAYTNGHARTVRAASAPVAANR